MLFRKTTPIETSTHTKKSLDCLLDKYFGYKELKPEQFEIIDNILNKHDVCAVLPTGFGKSMCYQIPFLTTKKTVIVVSPLIALMEDQVRQLKEKNIPVCSLNSTNDDKCADLAEMYNGKHKIVYTSPEYLAKNDKFISKMYEMGMIALVAIDEAHCVSAWGSDFRPDYQKLSCIREYAPTVPILALTATATKKIQNDICSILRLNNPKFATSNFDRPNLHISVTQRLTNTFDTTIAHLLKTFEGQKSIIYCKTRDDTDKIAIQVSKLGIKCEPYHAGKSSKIRNECQTRFTTGKIDCIVATIAFGLGINIPNIRLVIHYNCPSDLESYYQEIGRAGRDGKRSECHMFYSGKDFMISKFFINDIKNPEYKAYRENELGLMQKFIYSKKCRRNILLKHFDAGSDVVSCSMCDICCQQKATLTDYSADVYSILGLVARYNKSYGLGTFIKILRGSNDIKIKKFKSFAPLFYGRGMHRSEDWWKALINQLLINDYLNNKSVTKFGSVLEITPNGTKWLSIIKDNDVTKLAPDDKIMFDMGEKPKKIEKIHDSPFDIFDNVEHITTTPKNTHTKGGTINLTFDLITAGNSIDEIAKIRKIDIATIEKHIISLFEQNRLSDPIKFGLTKNIYEIISQHIKPETRLSHVYQKLNKKYNYMQISLSKFIKIHQKSTLYWSHDFSDFLEYMKVEHKNNKKNIKKLKNRLKKVLKMTL
jgi:RecQ family ATP-dependent DNA helicase